MLSLVRQLEWTMDVSDIVLPALISTLNFILLVVFSVAVAASDFLALPLAIEWFTLVVVALYLLVRESRVRGTPPRLPGALVMFAIQFLLGLVTSMVLTIRAWPGSTLCDDFKTVANSCSVALAVVGLSWLATTTGFRMRRRPKVPSNEHVIELVDMPSHQPRHNGGKEGWTDIPV
ncbi:hypothetical protein C8R44DRAFT_743489 [Mycena epipterygia]|nr:hypothetical protein C8R44DRAFT_743489 [Mycena epipterygia]